MGVEHHCFMKPSSWDKQPGLVLPLKRAARQRSQTNYSSKDVPGLDVSHYTHALPKGVARSFTKRLWRFKDFCSDVGVGCGWPSDLLTAGDQSGALSSLQA